MTALRTVHSTAGAIALFAIATFWISTVLSETLGSVASVVAVKSAIPWGFLILVPAVMTTGRSGFLLSKGRRGGLVGAKIKRMPIFMLNGLLVLIPSAFYLASKAKTEAFDTGFYSVQVLELLAGTVNLTILGLNTRDGLKMTGRLRRRPA